MSIQLYNSGSHLPVSSGNSSLQSHPVNSATSSPPNKADNTATKESGVELSTRAQKIQKLSQEFFPGGPADIKISPEFIQRLQEFGFISDDDAKSLGGKEESNAKLSGTLGEISTSINSLSKHLQQESPNDGLIDIINRADAIINNLDGSKPSDLATNIKMVSAELSQYLRSDQADKLTEDEKDVMNQLQVALKVADKMNPATTSSQKLNSYLSFS